MIHHLRGRIDERNPAGVVIECGGVGYHLLISLSTFAKLPDSGECKLYTHLAIREDAHVLFGFADRQERDLFRSLISVSGVGGNTAIAVLSSLDPDSLRRAIRDRNVGTLKAIKGIGPKTAERIIIDLHDRISKESMAIGLPISSGNRKREEALTALVTLGFARLGAEKAVDAAIKRHGEDMEVGDLVKHALGSI